MRIPLSSHHISLHQVSVDRLSVSRLQYQQKVPKRCWTAEARGADGLPQELGGSTEVSEWTGCGHGERGAADHVGADLRDRRGSWKESESWRP